MDRLEDLDLDTGLGLVLLGSVGSDDTLGIGETGSDGLFSIVRVVIATRWFRAKARFKVGWGMG